MSQRVAELEPTGMSTMTLVLSFGPEVSEIAFRNNRLFTRELQDHVKGRTWAVRCTARRAGRLVEMWLTQTRVCDAIDGDGVAECKKEH